MNFYRTKWFKILSLLILTPLLVLAFAIGFIYVRQDKIVQKILVSLNEKMEGEIAIKDSHISLFYQFPFISIDAQDLILYSDKSKSESSELIHLEDLYIGFNLMDLMKGNYDVKSIVLNHGHINVTRFQDGSFDLLKALGIDTESETDQESEMLHFALKNIDIDHVSVLLNLPEKDLKLSLEIEHIHSAISSKMNLMDVALDSKIYASLFKGDEVTALNKKLFELNTRVQYDTLSEKITLAPTEFLLDHISLDIEGFAELKGDQNIDFSLSGEKDNFNLLIAFAPEELIPVLKSYENKGAIFLNGRVNGSLKDGAMPAINVEFGCEKGLFKNGKNALTLDEIEFHGAFTNGEKRDLSTMKFTLYKLKAKPDAGIFDAKLEVVNFKEPDIDLKLKSNFNLDFLVKFLNMEDKIRNPSGFVELAMNFHDIIDLSNPEKSLEKLNESYYTELVVKDLAFELNSFHLPFRDINIHADVHGNNLILDQFEAKIGQSDVRITGSLNDMPAVVHQSSKPIETKLTLRSDKIDLKELSYNAKKDTNLLDEELQNLQMDVSFKSSAKALLNFEHLPIGDFLIHSLSAKLKNYPHKIHEVSAGLFIEEENIRIRKLKGFLDESDFMVFGKLESYPYLFKPKPKAKSEFKIFFKSNKILLENLLTYRDSNYLPEEIRKESFTDVSLKAVIGARFNGESISGTRIELKDFDITTSLHEKRFTDLNGKIFLNKNMLALKNLKGNIGQSDFDISLNYFIGKHDSLRKRDNEIKFYSNHFDLNEILAIRYDSEKQKDVLQEDSVNAINVKDIPFMDMKLEADIKQFSYLDYKLDRVKGTITMRKDKTIDLYRVGFDVGKGKFRVSGKIDAQDSTQIGLTPSIWIKGVALDETLLRFKNLGQNYILSENLSGTLDAKIKGSILLNPDFSPKLETGDLSLQITIYNGELKNYKPLNEFASFFDDKNLNRLRFDTLHNVFTFKNNKLTIPWMSINTSIGFVEVSGEQKLVDKMGMEYYVKVPLKLVTQAAYQKLFKRRKEEIDPEKEDEIQYNSAKKMSFVNIKMIGDIDDFSISLGKDKRGKTKNSS